MVWPQSCGPGWIEDHCPVVFLADRPKGAEPEADHEHAAMKEGWNTVSFQDSTISL